MRTTYLPLLSHQSCLLSVTAESTTLVLCLRGYLPAEEPTYLPIYNREQLGVAWRADRGREAFMVVTYVPVKLRGEKVGGEGRGPVASVWPGLYRLLSL